MDEEESNGFEKPKFIPNPTGINKYVGDKEHERRQHGYIGQCQNCKAKDVKVKWRTSMPGSGVGRMYMCNDCVYYYNLWIKHKIPKTRAFGLLRCQSNKCYICRGEAHKVNGRTVRLCPYPKSPEVKYFLCMACNVLVCVTAKYHGEAAAMQFIKDRKEWIKAQGGESNGFQSVP